MEVLKETLTNKFKLSQLSENWAATLDEVLQRGFHGFATIELMVTDGTIIRISRKIERIEK